MAQAKDGSALPAFAGKPLRDVVVPAADVWHQDELGNAVIAEYTERVRADFEENPFLKVYRIAAGIVHGSNPFAAVLVDMIVRPQARIATPPDLQVILNSRRKVADPVHVRGGYKDAAFVLRSVKEPNSYLAESFAEQLDPKTEWPVVIYLSGLELVKDRQSPCGLNFKFTSETRTFHAAVLSQKSGHFSNDVVDPATGLPARIEGTGRYFYGMEEGLARLYVGRGSSIDTIWEELGNSQVDGRTVIVNNVVPPDKVAQYTTRLDAALELLED